MTESGPVCAPGNDAARYFAEGPNAYGHPNYPHGTWTVDTADRAGSSPGSPGRAPTRYSPPGACRRDLHRHARALSPPEYTETTSRQIGPELGDISVCEDASGFHTMSA